MPTFYQKYRPNNFAEIVNQNHIKITLQNELETEQTAHAYLFCGPRGTGKTTMARVFAKALNCEQRAKGESEPCGKCMPCEQIKQGTSLDIVEIDAASHTGVDNVRDNIIASARVSITPGKWRVFIIDEVHMLSISAFNALLKTLEEPPARAAFILCTTEVHKLPTTIISRCQRFDFKRISVGDIVQKLSYIAGKENVKVEKGILETIARHSEGHMRDAESLLNQVFSISGPEITQEKADLVLPHSNINSVIDLINFIIKKDSAQAIRLINQLVDDGVDLKQFSSDLIESARRMMLAKLSQSLAEKYAQDLGQAIEERIRPLLAATTIERLVDVINAFSQAQAELKSSFIVQLPLEIAAIKLGAAVSGGTAAKPAFIAPISRLQPLGAAEARPAAAGPAVAVNLEEVKAKWAEVLTRVKKYNHSLSFILKVCEPREIGGVLHLVFKYKFHKERVEQPTIRQILAQAMQEVFGGPVNFNALLDENLVIEGNNFSDAAGNGGAVPLAEAAAEDKKEDKQQGNVDTILKMFGGKVVN
ncbi:DNA polymerase III, subunit gamma and tau [Candidatus Falkowbacteria bacterium RIFCSPLOWO2_12_FULL_45_10]|uniref:DNA polymerase III subunit gamma/tau n=1 Tax=Candidatus Falkowbacteria bacterium RIFCSPLOWO2_12_FULL_45_10 TaxID=1797990 RepID=A0A1F5RYA6_9BACT|nr:MAG: DNA polymerase III, subunit gamma and tau [Candidatus Falkowbacteria bacterium RIFCSPLOWO2_12_FULL_45_10]